MVLAFIALLAALSGTAIALPGKNTVDSGDIKRNSVRSGDIRKGNVKNSDLGANAVTSGKVRNDNLTGADLNESTLGKVPSAGSADTAGSASSATTAANASALGGQSASQYLRTGGLQSGQTLTGAYVVAFTQGAGEFVQGTQISFPLPLAAGPAVTYRPPGSAPDAACPGTDDNPQAEAGRLCVYGSRQDAGIPFIEAQAGGRTGFRIFPNDADGGSTQIDGTWAVTAP